METNNFNQQPMQRQQVMQSNGLGIAAFVLGILGFFTAFLVIGILLDYLAIILGIIAITSKKQKSGLGIAGLIIAIVSLLLMRIIGSIFTNNDDIDTSSVTIQSENVQTIQDEQPGDIPLSEAQLDIQEYSYENIVGATLHFLVIKNNSDYTVKISSNSTALDSSGKIIGATTSDIEALGSGNESCLISYFNDVENADSFKYTLDVKEDTYYESVLNDLSYELSQTDNKAIITLTNNGNEAAEFVEAIALFFRNGELVEYDSTYMTDDDSELKAGATIVKELNCYGETYDEVKIYFTGRR